MKRHSNRNALNAAAVPSASLSQLDTLLLLGCATLALTLERCKPLKGNFPAPVICIALGSAASFAFPSCTSACTDAVVFAQSVALPTGLSLTLLNGAAARSSSIASGRWPNVRLMMPGIGTFLVASVASFVASGLASLLFAFSGTISTMHLWQLCACYCSTFIGGSANFAATAQAVNMNSSLTSAALTADSVCMSVYLLFVNFVAKICLRAPASNADIDRGDAKLHSSKYGEETPLSAFSLCVCLAPAFACSVAGDMIASLLKLPSCSLAFVSLFAGCIAALCTVLLDRSARQLLEPCQGLSQAALALYFVTVGYSTSIQVFASSGLSVLALSAMIILLHAVLIIGMGKLFSLDRRYLLLASNAAVGGAGTAAATVASVPGWNNLLPVAITQACVGYGVGTPVGLLLGKIIQPALHYIMQGC